MVSFLKQVQGKIVDREFTRYKIIPGVLMLNWYHKKDSGMQGSFRFQW